MQKRTTIKDIARVCGVSPSLVSRTLNHRGGVSEATREKIAKAAARLDYSPNLFAKGLVGQTSNIIGIIIPQRSEFAFANPYFPQVMRGIGNIATASGYHLLISFINGEEERLPLHKTHLVSGIIVLGNLLEDPEILELEWSQVPAVLIPGLLRESRLPSVDIDNLSAGYQAAGHLLRLGHRRIAFLNGIRDSKYSLERLAGFQKAFQEYRLFYDESLIVETKFSEIGGFRCMTEILERAESPTGVICAADVVAIGALSAIKEKNMRVPHDLSVVSFGDVPLAGMLETPLTSVRIPFIEIGQLACRTLMTLIKGEPLKEKKIVLPVELIVRKTTRALR